MKHIKLFEQFVNEEKYNGYYIAGNLKSKDFDNLITDYEQLNSQDLYAILGSPQAKGMMWHTNFKYMFETGENNNHVFKSPTITIEFTTKDLNYAFDNAEIIRQK